MQQGLFPEWLGAREVLHRRNPYRQEITTLVQTAIYGAKRNAGRSNEQRFAYPVYSALLFLPLAIVPFAAAQYVCLLACLALTILSVELWDSGRFTRPSILAMITVCVFSTYPVIAGLQLRQPSLLIAGMLSLVVYWARSDRLVWAGMLAALCTSKPQIAIAILLPMSIWSVARWHNRKRFLLSFGTSMAALLVAGEIIVPGWFGQWLTTLHAYSHYAGSQPLLADLLPRHFAWPAGAFLIVASLWVAHRFCESDLLFAISFSIAVFQLIFPFLLYNEILLLQAALWLLRSPAAARGAGQLFELFWSCTWALLAIGAVAMFGLSLSNLIMPGSGLRLWQLPFVMAWLYPWSVLLALAAYAISPQIRQGRLEARP